MIEDGPAACCAATTPNAARPNVTKAAMTATTTRIAPSAEILAELTRSEGAFGQQVNENRKVKPALSRFVVSTTDNCLICCSVSALGEVGQRPNLSRQLGSESSGRASAAKTQRAIARVTTFAASVPSWASANTGSASGRRPVAAANRVSPSSGLCTG